MKQLLDLPAALWCLLWFYLLPACGVLLLLALAFVAGAGFILWLI
jgi:hypothetical protein